MLGWRGGAELLLGRRDAMCRRQEPPRDEPAFALMAAINGSTGSSATLSFGLDGTKPRRRQPNGSKILVPQGWRRKPSETLSCESAADRDREWENAPQRSHLLSHKPEQVPFVVRR